jgi:hypothetical protein
MALYEKIKVKLDNPENLSMAQKFGNGAFSGGLASLICTPLDVAKIRLQNDLAG